MSDGALTQEEINELFTETDEEKFERRKNWILREIEIMEISNDKYGSLLYLDAIINIINMARRNKAYYSYNGGKEGK